jgi:hypothetical protein
MLKRFLTVLALAALPLAYGVSVGAVRPISPEQPLTAGPVPPRSGQPAPDRPVHQQMREFDRRARTDMILYPGSFGPDSRVAGPPVLGPGVSAITLPQLTR